MPYEEQELLQYIHTSTEHISLSVTRDLSSDTFYGDEENIKRAVLNILSNAVEHSASFDTISLHISNTESRKLTFTVTDCGSGFSTMGLKNATVEFFTEKAERSGKHYGLGLYIARKVAEEHHGTLTIENKKSGHGAIVSLILNSV